MSIYNYYYHFFFLFFKIIIQKLLDLFQQVLFDRFIYSCYAAFFFYFFYFFKNIDNLVIDTTGLFNFYNTTKPNLHLPCSCTSLIKSSIETLSRFLLRMVSFVFFKMFQLDWTLKKKDLPRQ